MPRLFLVRHGEAAAGFGDHPDPGLSEQGRAQAQAAAQALVKLGRLEVVSSPLARARETADAYTALSGASVMIDPWFAEVPAPVPLHERRAWLLSTFPKLANRDGQGSSWGKLDPAVLAWSNGVVRAARAMATDTIIFTHFIAINVLLAEAQCMSETIVAWPDYASVAIIDADPFSLSFVAPPTEAATLVL